MDAYVGKRFGYPVTPYAPESERMIDENSREFEYGCCSRDCRYWLLVDTLDEGRNWTIRSWRSEGRCAIPL
jgi:hypothetical protein